MTLSSSVCQLSHSEMDSPRFVCHITREKGKKPVIIRHCSFERGVLKENGLQFQFSPTRWRVGFDLCLTWQLLVVHWFTHRSG